VIILFSKVIGPTELHTGSWVEENGEAAMTVSVPHNPRGWTQVKGLTEGMGTLWVGVPVEHSSQGRNHHYG